jgi:hypothetical protein
MNPSPFHGTVVPSADPRYPYALQSGDNPSVVYPVNPSADACIREIGDDVFLVGLLAYMPDDADYSNPVIFQI